MSHFPRLSLLKSRISKFHGKNPPGPPECADGFQVLPPRGALSVTVPATTFPRLQAAVRANRLMDDLRVRLRWRGEGAPGQVWRPGSRPALLGRPEQIPGVPSRPKPPAQPLALDLGSPRAAQAAGTGCFFGASQVCPIQPARPAHKTHARSKVSRARLDPARFANGRWPVPFRGAGLRAPRDRR
jgi:hypothetical protein